MKRSGYFFEILIVLGLLCTLNVNAQNPFDWQSNDAGKPFVEMQSVTIQGDRQAMPYSPTIYEVGTNELPSDAYDPTSDAQARNNKSGIRRGFDTPGDTPPSEENPVGDPFVLLFFALAFAATVLFRRKKV